MRLNQLTPNPTTDLTVTVTLTRACSQVQGASKAAATDGGYEHGRCVVAAAGSRAA